MISRSHAVETLNELGDGGTVRIRRGIILQHDAQVIRASALLAGTALPKLNCSPGRNRRRSCGRQIARNLVNLRGREAVFFFFFAPTGENCEKETNSQEPKSC